MKWPVLVLKSQQSVSQQGLKFPTLLLIFQENALYCKKMNLTRDSQLQAKHTEVSKRVRELTDQLNRLLDAHMLPKGVSPRCVSLYLSFSLVGLRHAVDLVSAMTGYT